MNKAHERLVAYIKAHPEETYSSIALTLGITAPTITRIAQQAGLAPRGSKRITIADVDKLEASTTDCVEELARGQDIRGVADEDGEVRGEATHDL